MEGREVLGPSKTVDHAGAVDAHVQVGPYEGDVTLLPRERRNRSGDLPVLTVDLDVGLLRLGEGPRFRDGDASCVFERELRGREDVGEVRKGAPVEP